MNVFAAKIRQMILPGRGGAYGPLPPLLVAMTVVTGLVDAFSYLVLGHVFVANMTGNVVFLAFALAGARGFSLPAVVVALAAFGARIDRDHHIAVHELLLAEPGVSGEEGNATSGRADLS